MQCSLHSVYLGDLAAHGTQTLQETQQEVFQTYNHLVMPWFLISAALETSKTYAFIIGTPSTDVRIY